MPTNESIPYFGRAWKISVNTQDGNTYNLTSDGDDPLRVMFAIEMYMLEVYWNAHVTVYNAAGSNTSQIMSEDPDVWQLDKPLVLGDAVTISAGYHKGSPRKFDANANLLYSGKVLQSWLTRENVVDAKFTMRLMTGFVEDALNPVSFSLGKGASDYDSLNQICSRAGIPIENIDEGARKALDQSKYSRGQAFHNKPAQIIREFCQQNKLFTWLSPNGLNVRSFDGNLPDPTVIYGPPFLKDYTNSQVSYGESGGSGKQIPIKPTLIGTPEQTQSGIVFRVLLDSEVKIGQVVQLAPGSLFNAFPFQYGAQLPPFPNTTGTYAVAGVRHVGDSRGRGDDWFTEIQGLSENFFSNLYKAKKKAKKGQNNNGQ